MSQIDELRQIIIGDNSELLGELKDRVENIDQRTQDVAEVLSPAIDAGLLEEGGRLVDSLKKPVSIGLQEAIRTEPDVYAEILYPAIAPSIRLAISQAISSMLVTINRTVESATSAEGIALRIQSLRTGVPYAELAMRQSLLFRVEHAYLIDRETGMLIDEVQAVGAESLDADAVSAMFSAIQSFVQDSFSKNDSERLTDFKVGERNVWVAHGTKLMLACVIFGDAPESLKTHLYDALDSIRTDFAPAIADFSGDTSQFSGVQEYITPLLKLQLKEGVSTEDDSDQDGVESKSSVLRWLLALLIIGALTYYFAERQSKLSTVEHYLRKAPGVAVTDVHWDSGKLVVEGLQDPDAEIPFETFRAQGIEKEDLLLKTIPFRSLEVDMELQRFNNELNLPVGVDFRVRDSKVFLTGESPMQWLLDNDVRLNQLAADRRLDISELVVSLESVSSFLNANFSSQELQQLSWLASAVDSRTIVEIEGRMQSDKLALLQLLFAGNPWVLVNVIPSGVVE